ncbi:MAG TPA: HAD family hydrolase [Phenylobacterium sp.]
MRRPGSDPGPFARQARLALRWRVGLHQAQVYPGVTAALAEHLARGTNLILCTAKARVFAERVVDHFGLSPYLAAVYGPELDGRLEDKGDLIAHILAVEGLDPAQVTMVGDRKHDVLAAARHAIPTLGVLWGYGSRAELTAAGAALIIDRPAELVAGGGLGGGASDRPMGRTEVRFRPRDVG